MGKISVKNAYLIFGIKTPRRADERDQIFNKIDEGKIIRGNSMVRVLDSLSFSRPIMEMLWE